MFPIVDCELKEDLDGACGDGAREKCEDTCGETADRMYASKARLCPPFTGGSAMVTSGPQCGRAAQGVTAVLVVGSAGVAF
eukprot:1624515-Rhodomonas_salina.1